MPMQGDTVAKVVAAAPSDWDAIQLSYNLQQPK